MLVKAEYTPSEYINERGDSQHNTSYLDFLPKEQFVFV